MRTLLIIGIGVGDPDHLTLQAVKALGRVQAVFIPDKGAEKDDLRALRHEICRRHLARDTVRLVEFETLKREPNPQGYRHIVEDWHARIADQYAALLRDHLGEDETGAFLVWGDPSLYDSTLRIMETVRTRSAVAVDWEVIPGITSVQALAASHRITLNRIGEPVHITTGRRLADGLPDDPEDTVVMLDGDQAFAHLGRDDLEIFWGAYLGTEDEVLVRGPLPAVADEILTRRAEARARKGWIMDTYLLRKRQES